MKNAPLFNIDNGIEGGSCPNLVDYCSGDGGPVPYLPGMSAGESLDGRNLDCAYVPGYADAREVEGEQDCRDEVKPGGTNELRVEFTCDGCGLMCLEMNSTFRILTKKSFIKLHNEVVSA